MSGLMRSTVAAEGCSPPQELEKAACRAAIFLLSLKDNKENMNQETILNHFKIAAFETLVDIKSEIKPVLCDVLCVMCCVCF